MLSCPVERAMAESRAGTNTFWIDVSDYSELELQSWIGKLELPSFITNRLKQLGQITHVLPLAHAVIIEWRDLPDDHSTLIYQVAALCVENLLITFDPRKAGRLKHEVELTEPSTTCVLTSLLQFSANRVSAEIRTIRTHLLELDERMDGDPASVDLSEIIEVKDQLLKTVSVAEEQLEGVELLAESESDILDFTHLEGSVRLLRSTSRSNDRMAGRLEKRGIELRQRYDAHQHEKLSHRLTVLTVLSAVFLPLTLIAGIWGMNFESMPELEYSWGYPIALSLMALVGGGMLLIFYLRGWFD